MSVRWLGETFFKMKQYHKAIDICKETLVKEFNSVDTLKIIVKASIGLGDFENARIYLNKGLTLKPDDYELAPMSAKMVGELAIQNYDKLANINLSQVESAATA